MDLAQLIASRASRIKNPSRRTPNCSTDFNNADKVERQLAEDSHRIWGWVIYRCTYESDADWSSFMDRLNFYIHKGLRFDNGLDMLQSLDHHVFDDPVQFDGAKPANVREHFRVWAARAPEREQGDGAQARRSQRYKFCLHVDREALQSVLAGPPPPDDNLGEGFVNLVRLNASDGVRPELSEEQGGDERELCWMRITYVRLMVGWYAHFRAQGMWFTEYRVPPEIGRL